MSKKTINILILVSMLAVMAFNLAYADSVMEKVDGYTAPGGEAIKEEVDRLITDLIYLVRGIFGVLAVIFIMWAGFVFWGASGDPQRMMFAKRMLAGFVICLIFVFMAEKLVGGALGLIGYDPSIISGGEQN